MDGHDSDSHAAMRRIVAEQPTAIDLDDSATIAAWCVELGVSEPVLRSAVETVGGMPAAVRFYVQGSRRAFNEPTPAWKATQLATRALRSTRVATDITVKQPERRAKPIDLDRLVVELRAGSRSDNDFAQAVARFCAKVADQSTGERAERSGDVIRGLFRIV